MTATRPKVTLVTPTYNQAAYIDATIRSVLAQTYLDLEYIVIDDGSTDETAERVARFGDRLRFERQRNMGQAATLNRGWAMAAGDIVGYISSDDILHPTAVAELVDALQAQPGAVVAYPDYELIDSRGRVFRRVATEPFDRRRLMVDLICTIGPGALFRRSVFAQAGGWDRRLRQVPDIEFWFRASQFGAFVRVPRPLAQSRVHEESATYRPMSLRRSVEVIVAVKKLWGRDRTEDARAAIGKAYLVAARNNIQSSRPLTGLGLAWHAALIHPASVARWSYWRSLLQGYRVLFYSALRKL